MRKIFLLLLFICFVSFVSAIPKLEKPADQTIWFNQTAYFTCSDSIPSSNIANFSIWSNNTGIWQINQTISNFNLNIMNFAINTNTGVYGTHWAAQRFLATSTGTVNNVTIQISETGTPGNNLTVSLYNDSGVDTPGTKLSSGFINRSDVSNAVFIAFNVTLSANITQGLNYYIVLNTTGGDASNAYQWGGSTIDQYSGGFAQNSTDSGTTWLNDTIDLDHQFNIGLSNITFTNQTFNINMTATSQWTCNSVYTNGSSVFALTNNTINFLYENSRAFNANTISGNTETFNLNITKSGGSALISTINLFYNNTLLSSFISNSGNTYLATNTFSVPTVTIQTNKTFYWNILLTDGTSFNTTNSSQIINTVSIDNCGSFTDRLMNMTLYDQDNRSLMNGTIEAILNVYSYGTTNLIGTFNSTYNNTNNAQICLKSGILNTTNISSSYEIKFSSPSYFTQYIFGQNVTFSNNSIPIILPLYDLSTSTGGQTYNIIFRDSTFLPESGVVVSVQRQYVSSNQYIQVEAPVTDVNGQATVHLVSNNIIYNIVMMKNGQIITVFSNQVASCSTSLCTLPLNQVASNVFIGDIIQNGGLTFYFSNLTNQLNFNYNTVNGLPSNISWNVIKNDGYGNVSICSQVAYSSIGTFSCTIPTLYVNNSITAFIYNNGNLVQRYTTYFGSRSSSVIGGSRVVLGILMYSMLVLLFISSPIAMVIGAVMGIVFAGLFFLADGGTLFGTSSIVIWFIIMAGIIIWQIREANRY